MGKIQTQYLVTVLFIAYDFVNDVMAASLSGSTKGYFEEAEETSVTTETSNITTSTPCNFYTYGCEFETWNTFYAMFVVGIGICFIFFLCAGCVTFFIFFTCRRSPPVNGMSHTTVLPPSHEAFRPPPDFEDALKCSKVEYKVDMVDTPPPVYKSLKFENIDLNS